jgi:hypothetical protein
MGRVHWPLRPEPLLTWSNAGLRLQVGVPIALKCSSFLEVLQDLLLRRHLALRISGAEPRQGERDHYVGPVPANCILNELDLLSWQRHSTFLPEEQQQVHHGRGHCSDELLPGLRRGDLQILGPCEGDCQGLVLAHGTIGKLGEVFPETLLPCPGRIIMALRL